VSVTAYFMKQYILRKGDIEELDNIVETAIREQ
jgi:hypothetical protein